MLTRSNYAEWAMLMRCNYEALEIWEVIEPGGAGVKRAHDRKAMGALLRSVPKEMWRLLSEKSTVKEAWEAVKSMRVGVDRVKDANAQRLLMDFENIIFNDGETVDDFTMRINGMVLDLRSMGDTVEDAKVVKKMLRVLPKRYAQIAISIETLLDLKSLTLEELVGRLRMAEDRMEMESVTEKTRKLMLTEEEWVSKNRHRLLPEPSSTGGGEKRNGFNPAKHKGVARDGGGRGDRKEPVIKFTSEGTLRRNGRCRNCGIYGHWKVDCKRPKKGEHGEEAHHVQAEKEPTLLLATVNAVRIQGGTRQALSQVVHLNGENVIPADREEDSDVWVLDTGASNHMTGRREAMVSLDTSVGGAVRFGNGSLIAIKGMGSVILQTKKDRHKVLTEVYFIHKLKSNIVSLGQLEEGGCKVVLEDGYCNVFDVERTLLARAPRAGNRLYLLKLHLSAPICLAAKTTDKAWLWHGQYGHLNFRALRELGVKGMVEGLPLLDRVEEFVMAVHLASSIDNHSHK
jgi:hypothetical protein